MNGGPAFERAVDSVLAQTFEPIDYIIIDGGSTDGTVDVIKRHADQLAYWISEPDRGISHAFNKGVAAARGDYVGIVNADDWLELDQIEKVVSALEGQRADFIYGDLAYHDPEGALLHIIRGDPDYASVITSLMPALNHPTMLARRSLFDLIGNFDERYRIAMDYDWVLRVHLAGRFGAYTPDVLGHMTLDGVSDRRFVEGLGEVRRIAMHHGQASVKAWPLFVFRVIKGMIQRLLQRHISPPLYDWLREWVNPHYRKPSPGAQVSSKMGSRR